MGKAIETRFRNGYENRARLADILTDDLIEHIENGKFPEKVFEVLKYLWEYELRETALSLGIPTGSEDSEDGEEDEKNKISKEALEFFAKMKVLAEKMDKTLENMAQEQ